MLSNPKNRDLGFVFFRAMWWKGRGVLGMRGRWTTVLAALVCMAFIGPALAQVANVGLYSPAGLAKAGGNGAKAVLLHTISGFCTKCEAQRMVLAQSYALYPGVERHVVAMDVEMETWSGDKTLAGFGLTEPGQMALVRGTEVLAFVDSATPEDMAVLLDSVFQQPDWAPVDPTAVGAPSP
jgi:hypothetical protein